MSRGLRVARSHATAPGDPLGSRGLSPENRHRKPLCSMVVFIVSLSGGTLLSFDFRVQLVELRFDLNNFVHERVGFGRSCVLDRGALIDERNLQGRHLLPKGQLRRVVALASRMLAVVTVAAGVAVLVTVVTVAIDVPITVPIMVVIVIVIMAFVIVPGFRSRTARYENDSAGEHEQEEECESRNE